MAESDAQTSASAIENATPAPVAPSPAATPVAKTFTQDEVNRMLGERAQRAADGARAQLLGSLKDYGVSSADELVALVKASHSAKQAELTELQRAQDRTKQLEADLARAKADADARAEDLRRSRVFRENDVAPEYEDVLAVLLDRAKTESPSAFDEHAWLESVKKLRPVLFGGTAPVQPAPSAAPPVPVGATTGVVFPQPPAANVPPSNNIFDANRASVDELRRWEQSLGIAVPSGGRF